MLCCVVFCVDVDRDRDLAMYYKDLLEVIRYDHTMFTFVFHLIPLPFLVQTL